MRGNQCHMEQYKQHLKEKLSMNRVMYYKEKIKSEEYDPKELCARIRTPAGEDKVRKCLPSPEITKRVCNGFKDFFTYKTINIREQIPPTKRKSKRGIVYREETRGNNRSKSSITN